MGVINFSAFKVINELYIKNKRKKSYGFALEFSDDFWNCSNILKLAPYEYNLLNRTT